MVFYNVLLLFFWTAKVYGDQVWFLGKNVFFQLICTININNTHIKKNIIYDYSNW